VHSQARAIRAGLSSSEGLFSEGLVPSASPRRASSPRRALFSEGLVPSASPRRAPFLPDSPQGASFPPAGLASISPSAPRAPSISRSSDSPDKNRINAETLGYVESFGDNSTQKFPHSPNPPHYLALAEREHLPSHRTAWRVGFAYLPLPSREPIRRHLSSAGRPGARRSSASAANSRACTAPPPTPSLPRALAAIGAPRPSRHRPPDRTAPSPDRSAPTRIPPTWHDAGRIASDQHICRNAGFRHDYKDIVVHYVIETLCLPKACKIVVRRSQPQRSQLPRSHPQSPGVTDEWRHRRR